MNKIITITISLLIATTMVTFGGRLGGEKIASGGKNLIPDLTQKKSTPTHVQITCTNDLCRKQIYVIWHADKQYYVTCGYCDEKIAMKTSAAFGNFTYVSLKKYALPHYLEQQ